MTGRRLGWVVFFLWATWLFAFQGWLASSVGGSWTPDLGLPLLLAFDAKSRGTRARGAAVCVALARLAFTTDPPLAVLAGYLGVIGVTAFLRGFFDIDRRVPQALFAGVLALGFASFVELSRSLTLAADGAAPTAMSTPWRSAVSTAIVVLFFITVYGRLPGLRPLWRARA